MDRWMLSKLQRVIKACTENFENYEYSRAKQEIDRFFWQVFCDNYLEIVKERVYNPKAYHEGARDSALFGLYEGNLNLLKLFAPFVPYITEEAYQLYYAKMEKQKSLHTSFWPVYNPQLIDEEAEDTGDLIVALIGSIRKLKSEKKLSIKTDVKRLIIDCDDATRKLLELALDDLKSTGRIVDIEFGSADYKVNEKLSISLEFP
jgi:valyl-tRNA synthetase